MPKTPLIHVDRVLDSGLRRLQGSLRTMVCLEVPVALQQLLIVCNSVIQSSLKLSSVSHVHVQDRRKEHGQDGQVGHEIEVSLVRNLAVLRVVDLTTHTLDKNGSVYDPAGTGS